MFKKDSGFVLCFEFLIFVFFFSCAVATAQDNQPSPSPTPTEEERKYQERVKLLDLKIKEAELQKAISDAQPKPTTTPFEGSAKIDDKVSIETHLVTYKAMSTLSDGISKQIKKKIPNAQTIMIYSKQDIDDLKYYRTTFPIFKANVEAMQKNYVFLTNYYSTKKKEIASTRTGRNPASDASAKSLALLKESAESNSFREFSDVAIAGAAAPILSAANFGKSFIDLLSIFRTDTELKGQEVSTDEQALIAETFRALRNTYKREINLLNPGKFSPDMQPLECKVKRMERTTDGKIKVVETNDFCSQTLQLISQLAKAKAAAEEILFDNSYNVSAEIEALTLKRQRAQKKLDDAEKLIEKLRDELDKATKPAERKIIQKKIDRIMSETVAVNEAERLTAEAELRRVGEEKYYLDKLQAHNQKVERFVSDFTSSNEKTGRSEFLNYLKAENFNPLMEKKESYWLEIKAVKAGGNNRTRKNLVLYIAGAKIDHSGGIIAEWQLYRPDGTTIDGNTDRVYEGYKTSKAIKNAAFKDKVEDNQD